MRSLFDRVRDARARAQASRVAAPETEPTAPRVAWSQSARPCPQVVKIDTGWYGRVVAADGQWMWTTPVVPQRGAVVASYRLLGAMVIDDGWLWVADWLLVDVDETTDAKAPRS